jgi:hypothetical protein
MCGRNKKGFYNYKVIEYNNRDRTDIKQERLFKSRGEITTEFGLSANSIRRLCYANIEYIPKFIYIDVKKVLVPIENAILSL